MSTTNNSKAPLYKILDEQRIGGTWGKQGPKTAEGNGQTYYTIHAKNSYDVIGFLYPYSDKEGNINHANVDYINLAANNLMQMADKFEKISAECLKVLEAASNEKQYIPSYILNLFGAIHETAKEALLKIS